MFVLKNQKFRAITGNILNILRGFHFRYRFHLFCIIGVANDNLVHISVRSARILPPWVFSILHTGCLDASLRLHLTLEYRPNRNLWRYSLGIPSLTSLLRTEVTSYSTYLWACSKSTIFLVFEVGECIFASIFASSSLRGSREDRSEYALSYFKHKS